MFIFKNFNQIDSILEIIEFVKCDKNFKNNFYYFNDLNYRVYNVVNNFSVPSFESGAEKIIRKIFPFMSDKIFLNKKISVADVKEFDESEIDIYARNKIIKVKDKELLSSVLDFIFKKITNLQLDISLSEVIDTLPKNTSSGFPEYNKKGHPGSVKLCILRVEELLSFKCWKSAYGFMRKYPVTIFHRFTPKLKMLKFFFDPSFKIRQILGTPFFIVAFEKLIMYNFVKSFSKSFSDWYVIGLTKKEISNKIQILRREARQNDKLILCGDINGCDKSISATHSLFYFQIASNFIKECYNENFKAYIAYFIRTPMLYCKGIKYSNGSTITGSWITSSFTTLSVMVPCLYAFHKLYKRFPNKSEFLIQGDDFVILLDSSKDKFNFKEYLLEFNLRLRLDKSDVVNWFNEIDFLGFMWDVQGQPDQTDIWIIGKIMYPEKYIKFDGPFRIIYRYLSIIINLKRFRTLFYKFTKQDPYLLNWFKYKSRPRFTLISERNEILDVTIPLDEFLLYGWRML
jgi:hypothetical protein